MGIFNINNLSLLLFSGYSSFIIAGDNPISTNSDEFDSSKTLSQWSVLNPELLKTYKVDNGKLILEPSNKFSKLGWYEDDQGPLVYKTVKGDFIVEAKLRVGTIKDYNQVPTSPFNSAGLIIRDPRSKHGNQNWIMYNIGYQDMVFGSEAKTTVDSSSILYINETSTENRAGKLRICRIGSNFYLYHWLATENKWLPEKSFEVIKRKDFQNELHVGPMINAWEGPEETHAEFDYVKFSEVSSHSDCLKVID